MRPVHSVPAVGLTALAALLVAVEATVGLGVAGWVVGLTYAAVANILLARALARSATHRLGPANTVTMVRAILGQAVAALVAASFGGLVHRSLVVAPLVVALASVALLLDAVDGKVARATGTVSRLGARFDMEVDAALILVLSVAVSPLVGWWVLLIGAARYLLLAAEQIWPRLRAPVPPRYWRKVVAATQGVALTVTVAGVLPTALAEVGLVVSLVLLAESFGRDVRYLTRRPRPGLAEPSVRATAHPSTLAVEPAGG